jgi:methionine-rich copper-binding protein CopC
MRIFNAALALLSLILPLSAEPACAHAIVVASTPEPRQVVKGPDLAIDIRFNSRVDAGRSRLTLRRPDGSSVNLPLEPAAAGDSLHGAASSLSDGAYEILWQTLSVDGHITHGVIPFTVGP